MSSSILQQYWIQQEKKRPVFSSSRSIVPTIHKEFDQIAARSDVFSSKSFSQTDFQPNSSNLSSSSSKNLTIKEFCPREKEDKSSSKRFVYHQEEKKHFFFFQIRICINLVRFRRCRTILMKQ
jgi:hypothetical protein